MVIEMPKRSTCQPRCEPVEPPRRRPGVSCHGDSAALCLEFPGGTTRRGAGRGALSRGLGWLIREATVGWDVWIYGSAMIYVWYIYIYVYIIKILYIHFTRVWINYIVTSRHDVTGMMAASFSYSPANGLSWARILGCIMGVVTPTIDQTVIYHYFSGILLVYLSDDCFNQQYDICGMVSHPMPWKFKHHGCVYISLSKWTDDHLPTRACDPAFDRGTYVLIMFYQKYDGSKPILRYFGGMNIHQPRFWCRDTRVYFSYSNVYMLIGICVCIYEYYIYIHDYICAYAESSELQTEVFPTGVPWDFGWMGCWSWLPSGLESCFRSRGSLELLGWEKPRGRSVERATSESEF